MKILAGVFAAGLTVGSLLAQSTPTSANDAQRSAIVNLRKFAMAESVYAMAHPDKGFACDPNILTKLEWPNSPKHVPLVDLSLLRGTGQYRFSAKCADDSNPAGKLYVFAEPLDPNSRLPTFCAEGRFRTTPSGTSEFPIRKVANGNAESCISSGKPLD